MLAVLGSALLHAAWNALIRGSKDRFLDTVSLVAGAAVLSLIWLPFVPLPARASWPYLGASATIHIAYFALLAAAYRKGELTFAYPIMRGSAPILSTFAAAWVLGEWPSLGGWLAVAVLCGGILFLAFDSRRLGSLHPSSAAFALGNACVIALYTLVDGQGARLSQHALAYTGWLHVLSAVALVLIAMTRDRAATLRYLTARLGRSLLGGACTLGAYGVTLWAMTHAPIAQVAALRETSVVFAMIIGAVFLGERVTRVRSVSIFLVAAGAALMKLA